MTIILNELQRLENISNATESSMILKRKHLENELLKKQNKQLKEVIEEVREVINRMVHYGYMKNATMYMATSEKSEFGTRAEVLLQILDKIKDVK